MFPCTQKRDQESENINSQKETHIRFLIHPYGNLSVDVPRLMNEMKLNVFRGGKIIYHADADKSLVDLLTKRFNPRSSYSLNAVKIFNDLNLLANLPQTSFFGKIKTPWIWSGLLQRSK